MEDQEKYGLREQPKETQRKIESDRQKKAGRPKRNADEIEGELVKIVEVEEVRLQEVGSLEIPEVVRVVEQENEESRLFRMMQEMMNRMEQNSKQMENKLELKLTENYNQLNHKLTENSKQLFEMKDELLTRFDEKIENKLTDFRKQMLESQNELERDIMETYQKVEDKLSEQSNMTNMEVLSMKVDINEQGKHISDLDKAIDNKFMEVKDSLEQVKTRLNESEEKVRKNKSVGGNPQVLYVSCENNNDMNVPKFDGKLCNPVEYLKKIEKSKPIHQKHSNPIESYNKEFGKKGNIVSGDVSGMIHKENINKLTSMSAHEIEEERNKLLAEMNPALIKFIRSKKLKQDETIKTSSYQMQSKGKINSTVINTKGCEKTPVNDLVNRWPHMDVVEPEKLQWMEDRPPPKPPPSSVPYNARFNFNGSLLPYVEDIPQNGLYHHGDEPERNWVFTPIKRRDFKIIYDIYWTIYN